MKYLRRLAALKSINVSIKILVTSFDGDRITEFTSELEIWVLIPQMNVALDQRWTRPQRIYTRARNLHTDTHELGLRA